MNDKILGILGGMGPQATQVFYQWILDNTAAECDQDHVQAVILSDTGMPDRTAAILSGHEDEVFERLLKDARSLEACGASHIAIPCNTSHYFARRLQENISATLINMPQLTVEKVAAKGIKKVAILATTGTIKTGVYATECNAMGIEAYAPDEEIQELVMDLIYGQIKKGEKGSRHTFEKIDAAIRAAGCDAAILGCTELSVYRQYHGLPDYYVDAMEVLTHACITTMGRKLRTV